MKFSFAVVAFSLCLVASGVEAQDNRAADTLKLRPAVDPSDRRDFRVIGPAQSQEGLSETDRKIGIARSLMRQRNFEGAASLLEVILESEPQNGIAQNLLLQCYQELNRTLQAEALVRQLLQAQPDNFQFRITLAELLAAQDRMPEAIEAYDRAAGLIPQWNDLRVAVLVRSELKSGAVDHALAYINRARQETGDSTMLALETGQLLERQGRYAAAVKEYFPVLAQDTTRDASDAEKRLFEMLSFVGSAAETEDALLHVSSGEVSPRALRLLSTHFIRTGQFDKAFQFTLQQDSVEQGQGQSLLFYMRQCAERKQYAQVCRMADRVRARYDASSPILVDALFHYGDALVQLGQLDSAIAMFSLAGQSSPADNDKSEALFRIGMIYVDQLDECNQAMVYFDSITTHYRRGRGYLDAQLQIPRCQIRMGELDRAAEAYGRLQDSRLNPDMLEEVAYQSAMIRFYEKQFDTAQVMLRKLMVDHPRGYYVNDALRLVMTLKEVEGNDTARYDFSDALYFSARRMPDSARERYSRLARGEALADVSLLKLAELDLAEADSSAALQSLESLIERFPESYYLPFGLKAKADVMMADEDSVEAAMAIYRRLLAEFGNYPFITEVRERLRMYEQQRVG
ncbi:tetratricopeptide repeat protein [bacterium]|nr:tetratricopeptide repeat protein [bacterium]